MGCRTQSAKNSNSLLNTDFSNLSASRIFHGGMRFFRDAPVVTVLPYLPFTPHVRLTCSKQRLSLPAYGNLTAPTLIIQRQTRARNAQTGLICDHCFCALKLQMHWSCNFETVGLVWSYRVKFKVMRIDFQFIHVPEEFKMNWISF